MPGEEDSWGGGLTARQLAAGGGLGGGGGGDASASNQVAGNNLLTNIDGDLGAPADASASSDTGTFGVIALLKRLLSVKLPDAISGRVQVKTDAAMGSGTVGSTTLRATLATDGPVVTALGLPSDSSASSDTGTFALLQFIKRLLTKIPTLSLGSQAPSSSLSVVGASKTTINFAATTAALDTNLLTGVVSATDWLPVADMSYIHATVTTGTGVSAGAIIWEQTNNPAVAAMTQPMPIAFGSGSSNALTTSAQTMAASTTYQYEGAIRCGWIRCRQSTGMVGGTIQLSAVLSSAPQSSIFSTNQAVNLVQIFGSSPGSYSAAGATTRNLILGLGGPSSPITYYSGLNVAAASGTASTVADTSGMGCSTGLLFNLTALTLGSSSGLLIRVEHALDGTNEWQTIWMERFTTTGTAFMPPQALWGRVRISWVQINGSAATTATLTVTATHIQGVQPIVRKFIDVTSGVGSGTLVANTNGPIFNVAGCSAVSMIIDHGTAGTAGAVGIAFGADANSFINTAISGVTLGTSAAIRSGSGFGVTGPVCRLTCTSAGVTQLMNSVTIYARQ